MKIDLDLYTKSITWVNLLSDIHYCMQFVLTVTASDTKLNSAQCLFRGYINIASH